jgi:hypothetical protein
MVIDWALHLLSNHFVLFVRFCGYNFFVVFCGVGVVVQKAPYAGR